MYHSQNAGNSSGVLKQVLPHSAGSLLSAQVILMQYPGRQCFQLRLMTSTADLMASMKFKTTNLSFICFRNWFTANETKFEELLASDWLMKQRNTRPSTIFMARCLTFPLRSVKCLSLYVSIWILKALSLYKHMVMHRMGVSYHDSPAAAKGSLFD